MAKLWSDEYSYDGGKYRVGINYSYSDDSIVWVTMLNVTSKFDKKAGYYISRRYKKTDGTWSDWGGSAGAHNLISGRTASNPEYTGTSSNTFKGATLTVQIGISKEKKSKPVKTITLTLTPNVNAPATPSSVVATKVNDARYTITVNGTSITTRPTTEIVLERRVDEGSWSTFDDGNDHTITGTGSYSDTWIDTTTSAGHSYQYRAKALSTGRSDSGYVNSGTEYTSPVTGQNVNVSISGNKATITWSVDDVGDIDKGIINGWYLQQSRNGGSFTTIKTVNAYASQYNYSATVTVSAGYSYEFRVVAFGSGGTSYEGGGSSGGETLPSAPYSVTAYRDTSDNVIVTIRDSSSNTASRVIIERSIDGGAWTQIASEEFPLSTYTDTTALASDSIKYRVKNTNNAGSSGYTESLAVLVKSKPNAPSLIAPVNGAVFELEQGSVRFTWRHNSTDGSPQRSAELQYKVGSGSWTTITKTTESYADVSLSGRSANEVITWRARTKGSHADWSDYSSEYTFTLLEKPEIHIISPVNAEAITTLPLYVQYSYNDNSGTLETLQIDIVKDGEVVKSYNDVAKTGEFSLAGFLFDTDSVYGIQVLALSSSGLRSDDFVSVTIQYDPISLEGGYLLSIDNDNDTGFAIVSVLRDITDGVEPLEIVEAYLYRVHDGERELVQEVNEGSQCIDKLSPLNVEYTYELLQLTEDGEVSILRVSNVIESHYSFIYFGDDSFKGMWNPEFSVSMDRPERVEKRYSGRHYPVSYDSYAIEETCDYSTVLMEREELVHLKQLMRKGNGQGIWKSADGDSYFANFKMSYSTNRFHKNQVWNVSIKVTRIEDK